MSELPKGWAKLPLDEAAKLIRGVSYKKNEASSTPMENYLPILRANNIQNGKLIYQDYVYVPDDKIKVEQYIKANDIVIAMSSGSKNLVGKSGISKSDFDGAFGTFCGLLRPSNELDSRFVGWFTRSQYYAEKVSTLSKGVNINNLKPSHFSEIHIPVAPLNEQIRIADKLDSMLAKVDAAQARLDKIPNILKRFRQSVLAAATSGELTKEWREENQVVFNWDEINVSEIVSKIEAGKSIKCEERPPREDEFGIIKISAVTWGKYDEEESKTLKDKSIFLENRRVQVGDFLISRANTLELLGMPVIVHEVTKNLMLSDKVLRLVMDEIEKKWLNYYFRSPMGRTQIENGSSGNQESMRNIGQKALMAIILNNPPLDEKKEIIRRVESLFTMADTVEKQYKDAKGRTNRLTQSILAKAFRGELVPQDSNDEPAVKLLEKIKNDKKTAVIKKPKTNRPSSKRKTAKPKTVSAVNLNAKEVYVTLQANKKEMTPQQIIESMKNDTFETIDQLFVQLKNLLDGSLISQSGFGENAKFKVLKL